MRNQLITRNFFLVLLSLFLCFSSFAQKTKKNKVRLKASYVKVMNSEVYFDLQATAKVDGENINIPKVNKVAELKKKEVQCGLNCPSKKK